MITARSCWPRSCRHLITRSPTCTAAHARQPFGDPGQMTWVLTSYIVAAAIMTPLTGWLADQIGRKRLFVISIVAFTAASALCGLAQSLDQIVAFRLLQGLSGAALIPLSQAVLFDINPPENHGRAMSMWALASSLAMLGPSWRMVDGQLQLALGVLHQRALWRVGRARHPGLLSQEPAQSAPLRRVRFRDAEHCRGYAAAAA